MAIRLIPTEGLMSKLQREMYLSVQCGRYLHAPPENLDKAIAYPDIHHLQSVFSETCEVIARVLKGNYVCPDFLSGLQAMQLVVASFSTPGDLVLSISEEHGGHASTASIVKDLGRQSASLPFDPEKHQIATESLDPEEDPALVLVDHSNVLRSHDYVELADQYPDAILAVDISQVMALVASGDFPNPLDSGADLIFGSTHKSMNGPQKAIAVTRNDAVFRNLQETVDIHISNNHPASVAALGICFSEFELFGFEYGAMLLHCARALSHQLDRNGITVYGRFNGEFTSTQHVWIDVEKCTKLTAIEAVQTLHSVGLIVNTLYLPTGGESGAGAKGLRLGTTEVARLGMGPDEMGLIAEAIADALLSRVSLDDIRERMLQLRERFQRVEFCTDALGQRH